MFKPLLLLFLALLWGSILERSNGQRPGPPGANDYLENSVACLDKSIRYRKRPASLVKVRTQVAIIAVFSLSSINMDLTADLYLYQSWRDSR